MKYIFSLLFFILFQFSSFSQDCSYNQKYAGTKMSDLEFTFTLMKPMQVSDCNNWYYLDKALPPDFDFDDVVPGLTAYKEENCGTNSTLAYAEWNETGSDFLDFGFGAGGVVYNDVETAGTRTNPGNAVYNLTGDFPTIVAAPFVSDDEVVLMAENFSNVQAVVNALNSIHENTDGQNSISFRHYEFYQENFSENIVTTYVTAFSGTYEDLLDDPTEVTYDEFDIVINTTNSTQKNFDWYNDGGTADSEQVGNGFLTLQGAFFITHEMFHAVGLGHIRGSQVNNNDPNILPIMATKIEYTSINTGYDDDDPCVINAVRCLHDDDPDTCEDLGSSTITLNIVNNTGDDSSIVLEWESNVFNEDVIGYNILKKEGNYLSSLNSKLITPLAANDKHTFSLPKEFSDEEGYILEAVKSSGINSIYSF